MPLQPLEQLQVLDLEANNVTSMDEVAWLQFLLAAGAHARANPVADDASPPAAPPRRLRAPPVARHPRRRDRDEAAASAAAPGGADAAAAVGWAAADDECPSPATAGAAAPPTPDDEVLRRRRAEEKLSRRRSNTRRLVGVRRLRRRTRRSAPPPAAAASAPPPRADAETAGGAARRRAGVVRARRGRARGHRIWRAAGVGIPPAGDGVRRRSAPGHRPLGRRRQLGSAPATMSGGGRDASTLTTGGEIICGAHRRRHRKPPHPSLPHAHPLPSPAPQASVRSAATS